MIRVEGVVQTKINSEKMLFPDESFEAAAYLFEQSHGNILSPTEISVIESAGFSSASAGEVANLIWQSLELSISKNYRSSAYWALGKLARRDDKGRFIEALRREIQEDVQVAYQVMVALDNLGEPVFSRDGVSSDEDDLNRRDAVAYLESRIERT